MTAVAADTDMQADVMRGSGNWWVLVITGIAWIVVSVLILDADLDSALAIGYLIAGFLIAAGLVEFVAAAAADSWKWLHVGLLGVLFVLGGIAAFTGPFQTFGVLASLLGLLLVLKGTFDVVAALVTRHELDLWVLMLIGGILEVALGFWAAAYPGRSAALLVLWVGLGALIRGVMQLVAVFQLRKLHKATT